MQFVLHEKRRRCDGCLLYSAKYVTYRDAIALERKWPYAKNANGPPQSSKSPATSSTSSSTSSPSSSAAAAAAPGSSSSSKFSPNLLQGHYFCDRCYQGLHYSKSGELLEEYRNDPAFVVFPVGITPR